MDLCAPPPRCRSSLDPGFTPAAAFWRDYQAAVGCAATGDPIAVSLLQKDGTARTFRTCFPPQQDAATTNCFVLERLVKTLLWQAGGWKILVGGPDYLGRHIQSCYAPDGPRAFDQRFMSRVFERKLVVEAVSYASVPDSDPPSRPVGRHLEGCRVGFDAGGSDCKVSAVIDGQVVFSEEIVWHPKTQADPAYHRRIIRQAMRNAAAKMPRLDAIGVSSAGIFLDNRVMAASLFLQVPEDLFDSQVKNIYLDIARELGDVPLVVANDGDVAALAGSMEIGEGSVLGLAMGTSEAGGYIDSQGNITGWLNELAFIPVDFQPGATRDEWSGDIGCGVKYFSQDAVIRLAPAAGIELDPRLTPAEKLKAVQELLAGGHAGARAIFETIGIYLGYGLAWYAVFYPIRHVLLLGRVTSGQCGGLILGKARAVLHEEFPDLAGQIQLHLPDEMSRRVGQSVAAASLPPLRKG